MSERTTSINNSSDIIFNYYNDKKNLLNPEMMLLLESYRNLYFAYLQTHERINKLDHIIFKHKKALNPFVRRKRQKYEEQLDEEKKKIFALVLKITILERKKPIQDILNASSENNVVYFADEVRDRNYDEGGSYLNRSDLY